jgi:hypothetical protein
LFFRNIQKQLLFTMSHHLKHPETAGVQDQEFFKWF